MEEMILVQVNLQLELLRDTKLSTFGKSGAKTLKKSGAKFFSFAFVFAPLFPKVDFCSTFLKSGLFYLYI